ncbi:MAG: hypothetical protein JWQ71_3156 [Pedosphaera sp.]|nr:hypothetical protein [Pedosphaera sp.]
MQPLKSMIIFKPITSFEAFWLPKSILQIMISAENSMGAELMLLLERNSHLNAIESWNAELFCHKYA